MNRSTKMYHVWINYIKDSLKNNDSVVYRELKVNNNIVNVIYDSSICNRQIISEFIISPLITTTKSFADIDTVKKEIITSDSITDVENKEKAVDHILSGNVIVIFSFLNKAIACEAKGFNKRALEIPSTETVIKGPRVGFNECLADSLSAIKQRIKDPNLKFEYFILGEKSKTEVVLAYIEGSAPENLINYVKEKIKTVKSDYIIYSNQIEYTLRCRHTPFDTIGYTEKPDTVALNLAEGKIAILMDGTPFVAFAPYFFVNNFHTTDDYTMNNYTANLGVILRFGAFLLSAIVPGLYIALFTHHFSLIPYVFIFRVASSRAGVPFPMVVEVLIMILFFQVLKEAGVRLPQPIGPTLSIVGALILGEAAVQSGLTSHVTVLVVALTSITSFLVPSVSTGIFIWNIIFLTCSSLLGLPGFYIAFVLFCSHLASLNSCGYPYLYPLGTLKAFKYNEILFTGKLDEINEYIFTKDNE